jgi:hypothetical protein
LDTDCASRITRYCDIDWLRQGSFGGSKHRYSPPYRPCRGCINTRYVVDLSVKSLRHLKCREMNRQLSDAYGTLEKNL